jgi:hypothetical protein
MFLTVRDGAQNVLGEASLPYTLGVPLEIAFHYRAVLGARATAKIGTSELVVELPASPGNVTDFAIGAPYAAAGTAALYYIDDVSVDRGL